MAASLSLLPLSLLKAHDPQFGVGTLTRIVFKEDRVLVLFDLSYKDIWAQGEMIIADTNKSSAIDEDEASAYVARQWHSKILPRLKASLDGKNLPFKVVSQRHEGLVGELYGVPFSLFYELESPFPGGKILPGSTHTFEISDSVVRDETPALPIFNVPYQGHGAKEGMFQKKYMEPREVLLDAATLSERLDGQRLVLQFSFASPQVNGAPASEPERPRLRLEAAEGSEPQEGIDTALSRYHELTLWEMIVYILLAIGYGAGHALAPGHGKTMVAAYLIGTRGRARDAVVLGLVTTVTHTGSVFLFGLAIFAAVRAGTQASAAALQNMVVVGAQMFAGLLLFAMGLVLFLRRIRGLGDDHQHNQSHGHSHGHDHHKHHHHHQHDEATDPGPAAALAVGDGHHHEHHLGTPENPPTFLQGGTPRLRDLLTIGFTGGLVPCPAGLTVILLGMTQPDRLFFGLLLLLFFSIGLGSVLVAIGILLITSRTFTKPKLTEHRLFKALPALSALLVAGLGIYFCARTYITGKKPLAAILRLAAEWLE